MVTVTRSDLSNSFPLFIRDVLRNNLTDLHSPTRAANTWILKGEPEDREFDPPVVIIDESEELHQTINLQRSRRLANTIQLDIVIWSRKMEYRDKLSSQITEVLSNPSSSDGTNTMKSQNIVLLTATGSNEDDMVNKFPKIIRVRRLICEFRYVGA